MLRTILSVLLAFLVAWCATVHAQAADPPAPDAATALARALYDCEPAVDLSAYKLTPDGLLDLFVAVTRGDPYLFYVERRLSYTYGSDGFVLRVKPVYALTGDALMAARALVDDTVSSICSRIDSAWSEAELVLYLHDALLSSYVYDYRAEGEKNYDIYGLFSEGTGVCQAFAMAFIALARAAGICADLVVSDAMDHAWCHVRVGDAWYHVDVTRDLETDFSPASYDRVLRSDAGMIAAGYSGFTCAEGHVCDSTLFENSEGNASRLQGVVAPAVADGGAWYATDGSGLPVAFSFSVSDGILRGGAGDVDLDGSVTLADLLHLHRQPAFSPDATDTLREHLLALNRPSR